MIDGDVSGGGKNALSSYLAINIRKTNQELSKKISDQLDAVLANDYSQTEVTKLDTLLKQAAEELGYDGFILKRKTYNGIENATEIVDFGKNVNKIKNTTDDKVAKMLRGEIPESESELVKAYEGLKESKAKGMNVDLQLFTELEKKIDTIKRINLS